jgi:hypothetical protein
LNKKYAIVSIVLIALMSLSLVPVSKAFVLMPSGHDDLKFNEYGPAAATLLIKIYPDYTTEFTNFKQGNQFDVMDWPLMPADFNTLRGDALNATFMEQYYSEYGLFEYDLNDLVMPTSIPAFRVALSWAINKDFFISYHSGLAGSATRADSPIASCTGYFNPSCPSYETMVRTALGDNAGGPGPNDYQDMLNAYESLVDALGLPVPDGTGGDAFGAYGNYYWTWTSPYPTPSINDGIEIVPNGYLLVFARASSPARADQGVYLQQLLEHALPNWMIFWKASLLALPAPYTLPAGCNGAHVYVDLHVTSRTICFDQAMSAAGPNEYRYHVYTGGWQLSRDPDFLQYYTIQYSSSHVSMMAHNYGGFEDATYDPMITGVPGVPNSGLLVTANPGGDPYWHKTVGGHVIGNATYWAYTAQYEMMQYSECALIPMWYTTGFKACLSADTNMVNEVGLGLNNWFSFLSGYNSLAGTGGYWEPGGQLSYGFQSDWSSGNPVTAPWVWDWDVLQEIYDSLLSLNPYNMGEDRPYLADSWSFGTWNAPGGGDIWGSAGTCTTILFNLREDIFWQDMPANPLRYQYTWNYSDQLNAAYQSRMFTPVDVAFNLIWLAYLDTYDTTQNGILVDGVVDHVVMNPVWQNLWNTNLDNTGIPVWFNTTAIDHKPTKTEKWGYGAVFPGTHTPLTWTRPDGIPNVQWSTSVPQESILVALTGAMGWIGLHRVGGLYMLPFHIWSQIPQDSWSYNGHTLAGAGWLDPSPSKADILYGTGPYILLNHNPDVSFTMIAYKAGASYRGISSSYSYVWYSPVRAKPPATNQSDGLYFKMSTSTLWMNSWGSSGVIHNYDHNNIYKIQVKCSYAYMCYNNITKQWDNNIVSGWTAWSQAHYIDPDSDWSPWLGVYLTFPAYASYIVVHEDFLIKIILGGAYTGNTTYGGDFYGCTNKRMWSDLNSTADGDYYVPHNQFEIIQINHYVGDVAGSTLKEPYYGADHVLGIDDVNGPAFYWGKPVDWTGNQTYTVNPTDPLHLASISGEKRIGIDDINPVAFYWGKRWGDSGVLLPPDPPATFPGTTPPDP